MKNFRRLGMLQRMHRFSTLLGVAGASLLLAACGTLRSSVVVEPAPGVVTGGSARVSPAVARTPVPGGSYLVAKGDTLYSIAFRNGVDFRDLAQWNQIAEPYTIWPGQRLMLSPTQVATAHGAPRPAGSPAPAVAGQGVPPQASTSVAGAPVFEPVAPGAAQAGTSVVPAPQVPAAGQSPTSASTTSSPAPVAAASAGVVPVAGVPTPVPAAVPPPAAPAALPPAASRAVSGLAWRWPAEGSVGRRFKSGDPIPGIEIVGKGGEPVRAAADGVVVYSGNGLVGYGELVIIKHSDSLLSAYGHNRKRLVKEGQRVTAGQQIAEMGSTGAARDGLEFQIRKDGNPVDPLGYLPPR